MKTAYARPGMVLVGITKTLVSLLMARRMPAAASMHSVPKT